MHENHAENVFRKGEKAFPHFCFGKNKMRFFQNKAYKFRRAPFACLFRRPMKKIKEEIIFFEVFPLGIATPFIRNILYMAALGGICP